MYWSEACTLQRQGTRLAPAQLIAEQGPTLMDTQRAKKHKKKECDKCSFVAELSIVFRRYKIKKHHQKCKSCEFTTAASSALKVHEQAEHGGGVLRTSAGFMITSDASNDLHLELEAPPCQDSAN